MAQALPEVMSSYGTVTLGNPILSHCRKWDRPRRSWCRGRSPRWTLDPHLSDKSPEKPAPPMAPMVRLSTLLAMLLAAPLALARVGGSGGVTPPFMTDEVRVGRQPRAISDCLRAIPRRRPLSSPLTTFLPRLVSASAGGDRFRERVLEALRNQPRLLSRVVLRQGA